MTLQARNSGPLVGPIVISRINYNPRDPLGEAEFLELTNISEFPVELYDPVFPDNLWQLNGVTFNASGLIMQANESIILTNINLKSFRLRYLIPDTWRLLAMDGSLSNEGEELILSRPGNPESSGFVPYYVVDRVKYGIAEPW
eukprot:CAMPEP_0168534216 /NCGR_PEP_ID=MMETSP0405-20121227/17716_1 /TAXON_ID=498012 /ORGANISM="Trichosphaerium sp, Strain Am-I-7 wt" /LENGTH=142 /DNA_ID=CAMNT_0008560777 /DNA_START=34 /DNA_END=459 /DNA_ORIENTATION=-